MLILVIQIPYSVYELIYIYTVWDLYKDFMILQDFSSVKIMFYKWNFILFTSYSNLPMFPIWSPQYQTVCQIAYSLTGPTLVFYGQFWSGMQTKQKPVDSFNDTVLITFMFVYVLQLNTTLIYLSVEALYRECS